MSDGEHEGIVCSAAPGGRVAELLEQPLELWAK